MNGQTERGKYDAIRIEVCRDLENSDIRADNMNLRMRVQATFDSQDMEIERLRKRVVELESAYLAVCKNAYRYQEALEQIGQYYGYPHCQQITRAALNPSAPETSDASSPR